METIVVLFIVGTAVAFSARVLYRWLNGRKTGCGCSSDTCPALLPGDREKDCG